eukprot:1146805-Pelagomonas_calceolata.AAC.5
MSSCNHKREVANEECFKKTADHESDAEVRSKAWGSLFAVPLAGHWKRTCFQREVSTFVEGQGGAEQASSTKAISTITANLRFRAYLTFKKDHPTPNMPPNLAIQATGDLRDRVRKQQGI